jgi:hypothetical protein
MSPLLNVEAAEHIRCKIHLPASLMAREVYNPNNETSGVMAVKPETICV